MSSVVEIAKAIMARYKAAAKSTEDAVAVTVPELFDRWEVEKSYVVGDRVRCGEKLYRCLTAHSSQASWAPDVSPSLWVRIDDPAVEWPEWVQPLGATDAYSQGAKVSHNGKHWVSNVDSNIWEPGVYGWTEVAE